MKKYLIVFISTILLVGCGSENSSSQEAVNKDSEMKRTIDACIAANPNYNNNDVARSILADSITAKFQSFRGEQLKQIENLPCKYEMSLEYGVDPWQYIDTSIIGKYVVKFSYSELLKENHERLSDDYSVGFQVFAVLDKESVMQLVDGKEYFISGIFQDFANNRIETGFRLPSGKCIIDFPSVNAVDGTNINLGTLILTNLSFRLAK